MDEIDNCISHPVVSIVWKSSAERACTDYMGRLLYQHLNHFHFDLPLFSSNNNQMTWWNGIYVTFYSPSFKKIDHFYLTYMTNHLHYKVNYFSRFVGTVWFIPSKPVILSKILMIHLVTYQLDYGNYNLPTGVHKKRNILVFYCWLNGLL